MSNTVTITATVTVKQMEGFANGKHIVLSPTTEGTWNPFSSTGYFHSPRANGVVFSAKNSIHPKLVLLKRQQTNEAEELNQCLQEYLRLKQYQYMYDRDENGVVWKPDWDNTSLLKYSVFFDHEFQKYEKLQNNSMETLTTAYFSEEAISTLLEKLNNSELCLVTGKGFSQ
jgi:uncharacterized membrane protein